MIVTAKARPATTLGVETALSLIARRSRVTRWSPMKNRITVLSSIMSEPQFMSALRIELRAPKLRNGISAVLRVRVNAHMATISRVGEHESEIGLLGPAGRRLRQSVRSSDLLATAKPGIFLMLLKNLNSEDDLATICERIIRAGKRPFQVASKRVYSGFNVGAAILSDEDTDAISLVRRATATMYQLNRYGDGGFELFPDEMAPEQSDPLAVESYISNALRKDLIELDFQSQYHSDGTLIGAGAMIRMYSPWGRRFPLTRRGERAYLTGKRASARTTLFSGRRLAS
jgi:GGDEF domain-containing protein